MEKKKSQHVFMVQTLHKVGIEGMCLSLVKAGYGKPTANITLNGEKAKALFLRSETRQRCPLLPLLFPIVYSHVLCWRLIERKCIGLFLGSLFCSTDLCLMLFRDDTILYIENPKDTNRKLLDLVNEFGKVVGYKINIKKFIAFL